MFDYSQIEKFARHEGWKYPPLIQNIALPLDFVDPNIFDSPWMTSTNIASPVFNSGIAILKKDGICPGSNPVILGKMYFCFDLLITYLPIREAICAPSEKPMTWNLS